MFSMENEKLQEVANILRRDVLEMTTRAGSGHPTSCMSCAEIMATLFFDEMKWDVKDSENPDNDEFILSKGHAAPILYSSLFRAGAIKNDLMSLRKLWSPLEGHPMPRSLKWVKVASGSLGQGASIGVGMALAAKLQGRKYRTYVLMGDSEMAEGSVYEALQLAPYYNLNNICLIIDVNRLGQRGETMNGHEMKKYGEAIKSFGWYSIVLDGHNIEHLKKAFVNAKRSGKPTAIICRTYKGKGVSFLEDKENWHGKALKNDELEQALKQIPRATISKLKNNKPEKVEVKKSKNGNMKFSPYEIGGLVATRMAYGKALSNLTESNLKVIAVDAEVSNSTHSEEVKKVRPAQFVETFIAEQNLVGICLGMSKKGFNVFGSTFAAFFTRAHDQIRMAALSSGNFTLCGSHAGVSIGDDGASQMALEDLSLFRALPNSFVFYPSDGVSTERIVERASKLKGIKYIRTTRGKTPVLYSEKEKFEIGDFKVLKKSKKDRAVLVGAGITLHECLKAQAILEKKIAKCAVVDLYCVKPFNTKKFISFAKRHGKKIVIAEDHYSEGGIGEMLAEELENEKFQIKHLAVREIPHSGKTKELLAKYGIDANSVVKAVKNIL
jgi:transketolase